MIQFMTIIERTDSANKFQISLAIKSICAQLLNSIMTPIIVNYYIKGGNIYEESGLIEDVFILSITSSFMPPLVRLIDPYYIFIYIRKIYYNQTSTF